MFISKLMLNPLSRQVNNELRNVYEMHRTVMSAFPQDTSDDERVLYRIDTDRNEPAFILLVQSAHKPRWDSMLLDKSYLKQTPLVKEFHPRFTAGMRFFFRLRANPTVKRDGKRRAWLKESDQIRWLEKKASVCGFKPLSVTIVPEGEVNGYKHDKDQKRKLRLAAVRFEGSLIVTEPDRFSQAINNGIGSAKGFGFGLLSLVKMGGARETSP